MGKRLSEDQIDRYARDGFVFPIPVLEPAEQQRFWQAYLELEERSGGRTDREGREWIRMAHQRHRWAFELASHPAVLDAVEDLIGPNILLLDGKLFPKPPFSSTHVSWHQDATYLRYEPLGSTVTAWLALTDSTSENGCMRMVPGSHRLGQRAHLATEASSNLLSRGQAVQEPIDESDAVDLEMRAGEMSLHHQLVIHGSGANRTNRRRVGIMILYVAPEVIKTVGDDYPAMLVRGTDSADHFERIAPPERNG